MTSGGARLRPGPAKDPDALRRDRDKAEWITLPTRREGPTPEWPLTLATKREQVIWEREWTRPQAVMWEAAGQEVEVALYVRNLRLCESPRAITTAKSLLQRQMADLVLTQAAMAKFLWRIEGVAVEPPRMTRTDDPDRKSAKARFEIIEGKAS